MLLFYYEIAQEVRLLIQIDKFTIECLSQIHHNSRMAKAKNKSDNTIAVNKKARHDYFIEEKIETGLVLEGWEVKSLRSKSVQIKESYVLVKNMEAWLLLSLIHI